jgi:hypothetical protein
MAICLEMALIGLEIKTKALLVVHSLLDITGAKSV